MVRVGELPDFKTNEMEALCVISHNLHICSSSNAYCTVTRILHYVAYVVNQSKLENLQSNVYKKTNIM
jgi:hypothetical protein